MNNKQTFNHWLGGRIVKPDNLASEYAGPSCTVPLLNMYILIVCDPPPV